MKFKVDADNQYITSIANEIFNYNLYNYINIYNL